MTSVITNDLDRLRAVLEAAETLLEARENEMLTADEWDALQHAVQACTETPASARVETFAVEHGFLVRRVIPAPGFGKPYEHRCSQDVYESIAGAIDDLRDAPFVLEDLRKACSVPWTQAAVALAFLKERGCITQIHARRHVGASAAVHADAMVEWHALREGAPGSNPGSR